MNSEFDNSGSEARDAVRTPDRNPLVWSIVGTALGVVLLYAATRKVDLQVLLETLKSAAPAWATAIVAATVIFTAIKAWRWKLLLGFLPEIRFSHLHAAVYAGLAVNFLVSHVGEFLRAAMVAKDGKASVSTVIASVVIERALDFIALLVILSVLPLVSPSLPEFVAVAASVTAAIVALLVLALYLLARPPAWVSELVGSASGHLPGRLQNWCRQQFERLQIGLSSIMDARVMMTAVIVSVVQWALVVAAVWCSAKTVGASVTVAASAATFVLIVIGLTLPNSPMQIGTTQLAFTIGLGTGGIPATTAVAASLVYTLFLILPLMLIGTLCLLKSSTAKSFRLRSLTQ